MNKVMLTAIIVIGITSVRCMNDVSYECQYYDLKPIENKSFGGIVDNIDLASCKITPSLISRIKSDVHNYQVLIFKDQQDLSYQAELSCFIFFGIHVNPWNSFYTDTDCRENR